MKTVYKHHKKLFLAEEASSIAKKMVGLMFRSELGKNNGMLFSFPFENKWSFWMFGMRFPIDIVFIDKNMKVICIEHAAKPLSLNPSTWKTVKPPVKCKHVIEINAGEAKNKRIRIGDVLSFKK
ncbi:MAG: DUF192 domain-containing protein [Candidatus Aenigmarchaeota archaeon]|nr:DUF192 domain-containing protein [Candidatus Aenigmarchaeota archaeon]